MYEQVSHALLNDVLDEFRPEIEAEDLRHFYTRLGANFYAIHTLFQHLYGDRDDTTEQMVRLVQVLADGYIDRSESLERSDIEMIISTRTLERRLSNHQRLKIEEMEPYIKG